MKKWLRRSLWTLGIVFVLINVIAAFHAYKFTHFSRTAKEKTKEPAQLSIGQKLHAVFFSIDNPRPVNKQLPQHPYQTFVLQSNKKIECWMIKADSAKGTVIIFHGFSGCKGLVLDKADEFLKMGYNTLLMDFMGSGGSEGDETTIGYKEAEEVKTCYDYVHGAGEKNIILFGSSMGAAAIIKAISDFQLKPAGIIVECPFGTMYKTTCARFRIMHVPTFPMAALLDFWGGIEGGFNAFALRPEEYAKQVKCPALLLYGALDHNVSREEIDIIYANLQGPKQLSVYPRSGHNNYLIQHRQEWLVDVGGFLGKVSSPIH
jgi:uncharacterized protein